MALEGQSSWTRCESICGRGDGRKDVAKRAVTRDTLPGPAPGAEAEVTGLVNGPELNGVRGRVVRHIPSKNRWQVKLKYGHGKASLRTENLMVLRDAMMSYERREKRLAGPSNCS